MAANWIRGALVGRSFDVESGHRVRLRLARSSDARAIADLLARQATSIDGVEPRRLVQYDPRERYVVCATTLIERAEELVGVGAIDLVTDDEPEPDLLLVDPELVGSLATLMWRVLVGAAQAAPRARAA